MNVVFRFTQGVLLDTLQLFVYYFNTDAWKDRYILPIDKQERVEELMYVSMPFRDVGIFFKSKGEMGHSFLFNRLGIDIVSEIGKNANLQYLLKLLDDTEDIKRLLTDFYFPNKSVPNDIKELKSLLENTDYTIDMKHMIFSFFLDPQHYIDDLKKELVEKYDIVKGIHDAKTEEIKNLQKIDFEDLMRRVKWPETEELNVSFCVINPFLLAYMGNSKTLMYGIEAEKVLDMPEQYNIKRIFKILSDEKNLEVYKYLCSKMNNDVFAADIAKKIGERLEHTYNRLQVFEKCKMVRVRLVDNKLYYKINTGVVDFLKKELIK